MLQVKDLRVNKLSYEWREEGEDKITGEYVLITDKNKVLAKQCFNDYGSQMKIAWSPEVIKAMKVLKGAIEDIIKNATGM